MTAPRLLLVLLVALGLVTSACGGFGGPSAEEYSDAVVLNRNRVDFVFGRITRADSVDEFLARMDEAAVVIAKASEELDKKGAPDEFQPEADDLVAAFGQLAVDLEATAAQARTPGFEGLITEMNAISFDSWNQANKALAGLAGKGVPVSILQRYSDT